MSSEAETSQDSRAPRQRKRDTVRTRLAILKAAGRNFSRRGYSKVSLQEIASEAGITPARIVHIFGSKKELFSAVASDHWDLTDDAESVSISSDPASECARRLIAYWNDHHARSPALALLRSLDLDDAVLLLRDEIERRIVVPWRPQLAGPDGEEKLRLLVGIVMGFGYFTTGALLDPDGRPFDEEQTAVMEKYLSRVLSGLFDA
ncbi:TetR/AcrR family transcriptional regulator [Nocardia farcinica]|uniref:TetR/AcrR family transcriptional regulator n=1 Tax=Nocardia farcinica TaxID=37329 RepID=UPI00189485B6|nr:TetR/AcrR family transcriptional regulator [Nocardia farcinica]MBF6258378.1 TetR/AcrR family transcriptional regulator [Nocardia farcinica]